MLCMFTAFCLGGGAFFRTRCRSNCLSQKFNNSRISVRFVWVCAECNSTEAQQCWVWSTGLWPSRRNTRNPSPSKKVSSRHRPVTIQRRCVIDRVERSRKKNGENQAWWKLWVAYITARCYAVHGIAEASRPSVHPSVCPWRWGIVITHRLEFFENNFAVSYPGSSLSAATPTSWIHSKGNTSKIVAGIGEGYGKSGFRRTKAMSLKRSKIGPKLLLRMSHTRFRLVPKSTTFDELEESLYTLFQNTCVNVLLVIFTLILGKTTVDVHLATMSVR